MRRKAAVLGAIGALLLGAMILLTSRTQASPAQQSLNSLGTCDRACLDGFVNQYLDALVAHDPSRLPVTRLVKFTENGQRLELGDGFWRTATAKGNYKFYIDDVPAGQVGFFGTMEEVGHPVIVALRLKIEDRRIAEIETIVARGQMAEGGAKNLDKLGKPDPIYLQDVPAAERASRGELINTANKYFSGMQQDDGKHDYSFFGDDCNRLENGMQTTNNPNATAGRNGANNAGTHYDASTHPAMYSAAWSCKDQFQSGLLHFVTRIRDRRYKVVDTERGIVLCFGFFDHSAGDTRTFQTPDGRTVTAGPTTPFTWEIAELFKVQNAKIHRVEAVLTQAPYGMGSGWSSWDEAMSDQPQW